MFGLSFSKIVVLVAVIAAVFFAFQWLQRLERDRDRKREQRPTGVPPQGEEQPDRPWWVPPWRREAAQVPDQVQVEDLEKCRSCGTFVMPSRARGCGRPDCPWRGKPA
jgi:uncharacterized protein